MTELSYTIPCHKRIDDLRTVWPSLIEAARQATPSVELVVVDYGNDGPSLINFLLESDFRLEHGALSPPVKGVVYRGRDHFHMAHARNLSIRAASGGFVMIGNADTRFQPWAFSEIQAFLLRHPETDVLLPESEFVGMMVVRRSLLMQVRGFDERFEFYGSEDKDLRARLRRLGATEARITLGPMVSMIRTTNAQKIAHYRDKLTKTEMLERGSAILAENDRAGRILVNEDHEWGAPT